MKNRLILLLLVASSCLAMYNPEQLMPTTRVEANSLAPHVQDEIAFWGNQVAEHALFMSLGFTNSQLKNEAVDLHKQLTDLYQEFTKNPSSMVINNSYLSLLAQERALQTKAVDMMKSGKWIGWLYPSLLKHMTMELDYFVDKLSGKPLDAEKEVAFWTKEAQDRIGTIAHLLDPSEKVLVKSADKISEYFDFSRGRKEDFKEQALIVIKAVNAFSKKYDANKQNIESIINDTLAAHELREGERGEHIITQFSQK